MTGLSYDDAGELLKRAKWNVKAAIVMQKTNVTLPQALRRLKKADDSVREANGEGPTVLVSGMTVGGTRMG